MQHCVQFSADIVEVGGTIMSVAYSQRFRLMSSRFRDLKDLSISSDRPGLRFFACGYSFFEVMVWPWLYGMDWMEEFCGS